MTPWVLLHGFLGRPAMWARARPDHAVSLALPGHGPRPWFPDVDSFDGAVDALAERLPSRCRLAGYSLGARLAMGLVVRHADRVAEAVLIGVHPGLGQKDRAARSAWDDSQSEQLTSAPLANFVDTWQGLPIFDSQQGLAEELLATQRTQRLDHTSAGLSWAMRPLGLGRMPCYREALLSTSVPVALVAGERDLKCCALARELGLRLEVVPGVGHNVVLEAPQAVRALL